MNRTIHLPLFATLLGAASVARAARQAIPPVTRDDNAPRDGEMLATVTRPGSTRILKSRSKATRLVRSAASSAFPAVPPPEAE